MVENRAPYLFIMEDDIFFDQKFVDLLPKLEKFVREQMLHKAAVLFPTTQFQYTEQVASLTQNISAWQTEYGIGTSAYFLTLEGARNLLQVQTLVRWEIDAWKFYYYLGAINDIYALSEELTYVRDEIFASTIDSGSTRKRKNTPLRSLRRHARFLQCMLAQPNAANCFSRYLKSRFNRFTTRSAEHV